MILTVKPEKAIIPIHTEKPEMFSKLDIGRYEDKVITMDDNGIVDI